MATSAGGDGLYASLKGLIATVVASGHSRLSLLGVEIELQKRRALREVLLAQAMLFCLGVGVLLLVGAAAVHFWAQRVAVLGGAALLFLALAGGLYWRWMHGREKAEPVFAANLAELQEDLRQLKAAAAASQAERASRGQDPR
jgi:uncharacterized membrane protein YqjE